MLTLKSHPFVGPFKPLPHNIPLFHGMERYWKDEPVWEDPIHHEGVWIGSVMRSMKTEEAVGVKIFDCEVTNDFQATVGQSGQGVAQVQNAQ